MSYTSGIFHIDLVSGSDAARTALTSCTASNPSGSVTRINKTAHGLVTGAIVDLTLFTAWLNSAWKITVVDANNFDLDEATWQTTGDNSGTVTPKGGSSWADAWLTINSGATSSRHQPGDEIRFAKTADPVSLGQNATWTDGSQTVTLTSAVTKKVEDAISGWTAAANITLSTSTNRKMGATAMTIQPAAGFTTGKVCHQTISGGGTQDFSGYRYLNFWMRATTSNAIAANTYRISLCSDTTGDTPVSAFNVPLLTASTAWQLMVIDLGTAMGSSIQSVSISALVDPATTAWSINNIFASNGDISLKTLIGKSGDVNYNIQSIDGVTIKIDSNNIAADGQGYSGATSTETLYYRVPLDVTNTSAWQTFQEGGSSSATKNKYSGGWNTSSGSQDGRTVLASTIIGSGTILALQSYCELSKFTFARFNSQTAVGFFVFDDVVYCGGVSGLSNVTPSEVVMKNCKTLNCTTTTVINTAKVINCEFRNGSTIALTLGPGARVYDTIFANNATGSVGMSVLEDGDGANAFLRRCTLSDATEVSTTATVTGWVWSYDNDNTPGNHWGFTYQGTVNWQTSVFQGSDPGSWKISVTGSQKTIYQPLSIKIAEVAVEASALVTVNVWMKKDHATNVGGRIRVDDEVYTLAGITETTTTKANDTSWEELTLTFTPTEAGIVPIWADAYYSAGTSNVYVGSVTITQA